VTFPRKRAPRPRATLAFQAGREAVPVDAGMIESTTSAPSLRGPLSRGASGGIELGLPLPTDPAPSRMGLAPD
jgi:hypothetical protein